VAIGHFGFSRRQWIVAIVLIIVAAIDMTRGYALVMSSVNTMQHSGESVNLRTVVGSDTATSASANSAKTVSAKTVSAKK
jgi:cytochrome c1